MWLISLRDLQWRQRRYLIGVAAAGLVFAVTLIVAGLSASFRSEVDRTVGAFRADTWVVPRGAAGPFSSATPMSEELADSVRQDAGVREATPIVFGRTALALDDPHDVILIGAVWGGSADPRLHEGRVATRSGEAVVDTSLGLRPGQRFSSAGKTFTVVGLVRDATVYAGQPVVYLPLADAQTLTFGGHALVSAVAVRGDVQRLPAGLAAVSDAAARRDLLRPLAGAVDAIDFVQILLWMVAGCIIGSLLYLSALERSRDFAVFKATGISTASLAAGLALQAVIVSLASAVLAAGLGTVIAPRFPLPVEIPAGSLAFMFAVAAAVGLLASLVGIRRAVTADPVTAFGGP